MNKRIKRKKAKIEAQNTLGVTEAYQRLEADFMSLAQALLTEGREKSADLLGNAKELLASSEETIEQLLAKVPGMGPQLKEMLHAATHAQKAADKAPN